MIDNTRGQVRGVERLYLDFDSFFATAEQHFNVDLRDRPLGVVPLDVPTTGCIAISREAKALGLKSGATINAARELIPDMVFVVARHDVYVRLHNRIVDVVNTCLPVTRVRSVDEVVCNLLPCEAAEGAALAVRIKHALACEFSDVLTCSIGMAPTELLAKIAAETSKPDGFSLINETDLPWRLNHLPLDSLPGISNGIERRLNAAGIVDFSGLWRLAPKQARAIWGSVEGERFWNGLHCYHVERPDTKKRMFGHSRMLPSNWRDAKSIEICARQLSLSASRRLRRADLRASKLSLSFRGGGYRGRTESRKDNTRWDWQTEFLPARDDHTFLRALSQGLQRAEQELNFKPRSVSVMLHGLTEISQMTAELFEIEPDEVDPEIAISRRWQWERVSDVMDRLRTVHGPEAISLGPRIELPGGYLGAKIAFGRIPDAADFSSAPVPDAATHFCSF